MHIPTAEAWDLDTPVTPRWLHVEPDSDLADDTSPEDSKQTLRLDDLAGPEAAVAVDGRRYLPHQSWQELYELYCSWSDRPVHRTSFKRYYLQSEWQDQLRIADSQKHGKCSCCEKLKLLRKTATCEAQLKQIGEAHSGHVKSVMLDRQCDALAVQMGRDSVTTNAAGCPKLVRECALLNWTQDGMDQSKFRCPRNTSMAKSLADSWRPQIGCHGLQFDGVGKFLFLCDQDVGKNADVQCSVMARALEAFFWSCCFSCIA